MEVIIDQDLLFNNITENEELYGESDSFLETACMRHLGNKYNSNCYEIKTIKLFMDEFLDQDIVARYNASSPIIVEKLHALPTNALFYEYIYTYFVDQCVEAIDSGNYHLAKERFVAAIDSLEDMLNIKPEKNSNKVHTRKI